MTVLLCASSTLDDPSIERVASAVRERGARVQHLDASRFPVDYRLTMQGGERLLRDLRSGDELDLASVTAVWLRHLEVASGLGAELDPAFRDAVAVQSELALYDMLGSLDALQIDHPDALSGFCLATRQLGLAERAGLAVPASLLTNDPDRVRAFAARHGTLVGKMVHSSMVKRQTDAGPAAYKPRLLGEEELREIDRVALCPMLFQERIPKALELRITVVAHQLFVAAVDSSQANVCDWAEDRALIGAFRPYDGLPEAVREGILRLLTRLRLNFGTVDMILTPDGRYVFLEVNGISYYDFIEQAAGLPISDAIADVLTGRQPPRCVVRGDG